MAGISTYLATAVLNAVFDAQALDISARYLQLHVGDPGPDCTSNVAVNAERQRLDNATALVRSWVQGNTLVWDLVPASETYSYVSIWDSASGGNALWSGPMTQATAVNADDSFTLPTSSVTVSVA